MEERPFFEFNMVDIKESAVEELKKCSKSIFDLDYILNTTSEPKYTREIKRFSLD
jgi:predicted type IV restriction endonuclease